MFDAMYLEEAISDLYNAGCKDDNLSLIYQANKEIFVSVNTPHGQTEEQTIQDVVLQGDTFGSLLASVQEDNICQEVDKLNE